MEAFSGDSDAEFRLSVIADYVTEPISQHKPKLRAQYVRYLLKDHRDKLKKGEKVLVNLRGNNVEGTIERDISGNETSVLVSIGGKLVQKDLATIYGFDKLFDDTPLPKPPAPPQKHVTIDLTGYTIGKEEPAVLGGMEMGIHWHPMDHSEEHRPDSAYRHLITKPRYKHKHDRWRGNVEGGMTPLKDMTTKERDERRRAMKKVSRARERIAAGEYYTGRRGGELKKGASRGPQLPLNPEEAELAEGEKRHRGAEKHGSTLQDFKHTAMLMGR
mgnify:CR=1 FL=1